MDYPDIRTPAAPDLTARAPDPSGRPVPTGVGISLTALCLLSTLVGRALSAALPGSGTGIGDFIRWSERVGAVLSQLTVVFGATTASLLLINTLLERRLSRVYRLAATPCGAAVLTLVALSVQRRLDPTQAVVMATCAGVLGIVAAGTALASPRSRAAGLVLLFAVLSGTLFLFARLVLGQPDEPITAGSFELSRSGATIAWGLDVLSLVVASVWICARSPIWTGPVFVLLAGFAALAAWLASAGSLDGASLGQVVAARMMAELVRPPLPHVSSLLRHSVEAFALLLAAAAAFAPQRPLVVRIAVSLTLLARASFDIPMSALFLVLGGLLTPLVALDQSELGRRRRAKVRGATPAEHDALAVRNRAPGA